MARGTFYSPPRGGSSTCVPFFFFIFRIALPRRDSSGTDLPGVLVCGLLPSPVRRIFPEIADALLIPSPIRLTVLEPSASFGFC